MTASGWPAETVAAVDDARLAGVPRGRVAGLVLAAGGGRRLGGVAKALLPHEGEFLVERAVRTARLGGCDPVVVVLGFEAEVVGRRADLAGCVVVVNSEWGTGLGSSLRVGLAAAPADCSAVAVLLVDQPFVGPEAVRGVLDAHVGGADIVTASYHGRRGHPVLIAAGHWGEVRASAVGDQGARAFLAAHEAEAVIVDCSGLGSLDDIDTPADLARWQGG